MTCPDCRESELIIVENEGGRYYACQNPDCNFVAVE